MTTSTRRRFLGSLSAGAATSTPLLAQGKKTGQLKIKITDLRCAIIGRNPVIRVVTDQGISGYGQAESSKAYLKPMALFYKDYILGEDPTDVERVMLKIGWLGAFKPWGAAVSGIEIALWDIAGQVAGVPVYKLLGGKIRDRVRIYNGGFRPPMKGQMPQNYAENVQMMKEAKEGFTLIKMAVGFHNAGMMTAIPDMWYDESRTGAPHGNRGQMTERGLNHVIACVEAMKKVLGDQVGLALDAGPGWTVKDAIRFCRACEPMNLAWVEDILTGDYTPYPNAELFRDLKQATSVPIHTGEQIYLRQNFKDLIEKQAVDILGRTPKTSEASPNSSGSRNTLTSTASRRTPWHLRRPHRPCCARAHGRRHAAEFPCVRVPFRATRVVVRHRRGLAEPIVTKGFINVWDRPGLGVTFRAAVAKARLSPEDRGFFDVRDQSRTSALISITCRSGSRT